MTTTTPVRRALAGVLAHADLLGLPKPRRIDVDTEQTPVLSFANTDDLQAWAKHSEEPVTVHGGHLECSTTLMDLDVRLVAAAEVQS